MGTLAREAVTAFVVLPGLATYEVQRNEGLFFLEKSETSDN
jgi:hypothetical protein